MYGRCFAFLFSDENPSILDEQDLSPLLREQDLQAPIEGVSEEVVKYIEAMKAQGKEISRTRIRKKTLSELAVELRNKSRFYQQNVGEGKRVDKAILEKMKEEMLEVERNFEMAMRGDNNVIPAKAGIC